jgi:hypothetical protein
MRKNTKPREMSREEQITLATDYCDHRDRGLCHTAAVKLSGALRSEWAYRYNHCNLHDLVRVVTERGYHRDANQVQTSTDLVSDAGIGDRYCNYREAGFDHKYALDRMGITGSGWYNYIRPGKHPAVRIVLIERGFLTPKRKTFGEILPYIIAGERVQRDGASWYITIAFQILTTYRAIQGGWERKEMTTLIGADLLAKDWTILSDAE